jgi:N-succinyl-L-ornithine transcarbamylase
MKKFTSVQDVANLQDLVIEAKNLKNNPYAFKELGKNKTLGLVFMNPSLRTRLSTQKAALNLGMDVMVMNLDKEGWALETQEGAVMNGTTVEHIKEAAAVMGQYCDIIGIRSFPKLQSQEEDYQEELLNQFISYSKVPIVSLESATRHPLQSLADLLTITENTTEGKRPKVVLSWAPHIKPIPHCVANSFAEWMSLADVDLVITHPEGYELADEFTNGATVTTNQQEALKEADFVYVKNWSSYTDYGKVLTDGEGWMLTNEKLQASNSAKVMHCLPVRRSVELSDEILDGENSLVLEQANNRTYAAQAVLKQILENL